MLQKKKKSASIINTVPEYNSRFVISQIKPSVYKEILRVRYACSVVSDSLRPHGLLGSAVHGIFQARILQWVAISLKQTLYLFHKFWTLRFCELNLFLFKTRLWRNVMNLKKTSVLFSNWLILTIKSNFSSVYKCHVFSHAGSQESLLSYRF